MEVAFFLLTLLVIIFSLSIVFRQGGWPENHEGLAFKYRTEIYAEHIKKGDIFPIWASSDAYDMGTPLPLFYHKVFYYLSALLLLILGSVKLAIGGAIMAFMFIGSYGIRACAKKLTKEKILIFIVPQAFLLANYTFTNWLVRGAMAEFSAMMLVPWVIWWCLNLLKNKEFSLFITLIMFFLFYSHSAIALMSLIPLSIAYGIYLTIQPKAFHKTYKRAVLSVILLLILLLPGLVLYKAFLGDYNPGKITEAGYRPVNNFQDLSSYFLSRGYVWLDNWKTYTVQLDYGLWLPLIVLVTISGAWWLKKKKKVFSDKVFKTYRPALIFLLISLLTLMLLQLKASKPVYDLLRPLDFMQFPWRLLAYITPLMLLVVTYGLSVMLAKLKTKVVVKIFIVMWGITFLVFSPIRHSFKYSFFDEGDFLNPVATNYYGGIEAALTGIGEYLPKVTQDNRELQSLEVLQLYRQYYEKQSQGEVKSGGPCSFDQDSKASFEVLDTTIRIKCSQPSVVALPITYSKYTQIFDVTGKTRRIYFERETADPRIIVQVKDSITLKVKFPTVARVASNLLK